MEAKAKVAAERAENLLAQLRGDSSQVRTFGKQFGEAQAKTNRYLERCRATLDAGGRLEDVEREQ